MKREIVERKLMEAGIPARTMGLDMLVDAVMMQEDPQWKNAKWGAVLFNIGQRHGKTACNVERNMRYALDAARKYFPHRAKEWFGIYKGTAHSVMWFWRTMKDEECKNQVADAE